jgi:drug/metabolite transporter (DMT)-like permease
MIVASAVAFPIAVLTASRDIRGLSPSDHRRLLLGGAFLAAHFALWISSLSLTSVASSVVLVTTTPLWVALAAPFVLGEHGTPALYRGIAVAFCGAALIGLGDLAFDRPALLGDLLALAGAWAAAAYFLVGRDVRPRVTLVAYIAVVYGVSAVLLAALAVGTGAPMSGFSTTTWACLLLLGLVPQLLGHSSFNWALRRLSATFVSAAVLAEAVGSTLLAWLVLGEAPSIQAIVGGSLVLGGLVAAARAEGFRDSRETAPGPAGS